MIAVSSRGGGLPSLVGGIEQGLVLEQSAGDRQQTVGNSAQGATVTVTTSAQFGVAVTAGLVVLGRYTGPMIESCLQSPIAGVTPQDDAGLTAAPGHWSYPGQATQSVIVSPAQR